MIPTGAPIGDDDLQAYIDGRLDEPRTAEVEAYLDRYPELRDRVDRDRQHRGTLRLALAGRFGEPVPPRLRIANLRVTRRGEAMRRWRSIAAAVLIFAAGIGAGWVAGRTLPANSAAATVATNASAAYRTYVVEVAHPVEVDAGQEEHLLRWLSKRLGRQLTAPDLVKFGYRLMGGRLLPAGGSAAAQLMYEDAKGLRLALYVQAETGTETAFRFRRDGDMGTFVWIDRGFGFAVTARASREMLLPIAETVYRHLEESASPHA